MIAFSSCTRRIYVPVQSSTDVIAHDSALTVRSRFDSVTRIDSVIIERRGDTVYHKSTSVLSRLRLVHDTICVSRRDTVIQLRQVAADGATAASSPGRQIWQSFSPMLPFVIILLIIYILYSFLTRFVKKR